MSVASASIAQQALDEGLLDEVLISLVPVVQGHRATHLRYRVRRS